MSLVGGIVVFIVCWWLTLFAVLPWGITSQAESGEIVPGTEPGAPARPALLRKALITTAIASVLWLIIYFIIANGWLTMDSTPMGLSPQS